jgi:cellulose synthase operon protein C
LRQGDPAAAEDELTRAIQLGVDRSEVVVPLAQAFLRQGKYRELLDRFPPEGLPIAQRAELLVLRGQSLRSIGDAASALRAYQDAAVLDAQNLSALLAQADVLSYQGKIKDASTLVERALSVAPNDAAAWNVKAAVAPAAGDIEGALAAYAKCLSIAPQFTDARVGRASLLVGLGRDVEAATDLDYLR